MIFQTDSKAAWRGLSSTEPPRCAAGSPPSGDNGSLDQARPRIYAACLAAYNNGYLHGRWIDAAQDPEDIQAEVSAMLRESPMPDAEEWAIHDTEGFEGSRLEEYGARSGTEDAPAQPSIMGAKAPPREGSKPPASAGAGHG